MNPRLQIDKDIYNNDILLSKLLTARFLLGVVYVVNVPKVQFKYYYLFIKISCKAKIVTPYSVGPVYQSFNDNLQMRYGLVHLSTSIFSLL